ncbi:class I SAM-dependent methyltransferase [Microbaculum marinisediminis]|uniref:Class I SAM-dependent methyltransferase n=1 Tax=Microbaculum marinisediminis TaxID=2931392 RepID=A0AAW5QVF0_9HYPH|nr:class I SAM-dependent methyltransferase [Microbaculum sp. A6E488]MCT8970250.1 class I SAM-dependent methyltransferase [Microbaculum sp. A6E488]
MATAIERIGLRAGYGLRQGPRIAWYLAHGYAMGRLRRMAEEKHPDARRQSSATKPTPNRDRLWRDLAALFARDLANVEAGIYPMPNDHDGALPERFDRSRAFFLDLPEIFTRRREEAHQEVFSEEFRGRFPRYYLQNFHYQSGGYLSEGSAKIYDLQVEVLFNGTANAMRRQALVPIHAALKGRDQRTVALTDVACGTGRFLRALTDAFPGVRPTGFDLSEPYVEEARRHFRRRGRARFAVANAEALPLPDDSQDVVTTIFLYHELPPKVRRIVAREFARVLKPGGTLVFMDSLQLGDVADYDGLLEMFPSGFHEPFYESYTREDLTALFGEAGLEPVSATPAFVSKVMAFKKP